MSIKGNRKDSIFKAKENIILNSELHKIKVSNIIIPFYKFSSRKYKIKYVPKNYIHLTILKKEMTG